MQAPSRAKASTRICLDIVQVDRDSDRLDSGMDDLRQSTLRPVGGETVGDRRRADRQLALWMGRCHVQDEPLDLWRECAVVDVSTLGVGIDLFHHPDPIDLLGLWHDGELRLDLSSSRRITLRLELGPSVDVMVEGEVRNAGSRPDGAVRVGIEFVDLTETERSVLDLLESRAVARLPEPGPTPPVPREEGVLGQRVEDSAGQPVEDPAGQPVEDPVGLPAEDPENRLGSLRLPIRIPGYELCAKGVSYVTNRPFVVEATRSLDLVSRPVCNFLVTCQGWLARPWQAAPGQDDHDEDVLRKGSTKEGAPVSLVRVRRD